MTRAAVLGLSVGLLFAGVAPSLAQGLSVSSLSPPATQGDIAAAMQAVPFPSAGAPPATALDGARGVSTEYARADHTHAARVQRTVMTTAADGTVSWIFARPIICPVGKVPPISYMVEDTTVPPGSPVIVQITARAMTSDGVNDTHTGITVKAQRSRALPATILAVTNLISYDVFGQPAVGTKVNLWAADPTQ